MVYEELRRGGWNETRALSAHWVDGYPGERKESGDIW